jgi:hypothetical protein
MDLPIYMATAGEEDGGITFISLVDKPAIQRDFLAFSEKQRYAIQSEEKRIITGAAMLADLPIYRKDDERGEYYIVFNAQTIWELAKKFSRQQKYNSVNTNHDAPVNEGVHMMESYFVNRERGINPPTGFEDAKDGSWFVSYLVDNEEVWGKVKEGVFNGFSIEGFFGVEKENEELSAAKDFLSYLRNFRTSLN